MSASPAANPAITPLVFGSQVKLLGGNGEVGDFDRTPGLPEKRSFDQANAVIPIGDEIYFLEKSQGRIGLFSKPFNNPGTQPYRIPTIFINGFKQPADMVAYKDGFLVSDSFAHQVFWVTKDGKKSVFAGTGIPGAAGDGGDAVNAQFDTPSGLAVGPKGQVYIADLNNHVIRMVSPEGKIQTVAGMMGIASEESVFTSGGKLLRNPSLLTIDNQGHLYVYDKRNQIRRLSTDGALEVVAGSGAYEDDIASASHPGVGLGKILDMAIGPDGWLYYGDATSHVIRRFNPNVNYADMRSELVVGSHKTDAFPYYDDAPDKVTVGMPSTFGFDASSNLIYFEASSFRWLVLAKGTGSP
jgi:hypothetical protein